jgi:hypothetical protein
MHSSSRASLTEERDRQRTKNKQKRVKKSNNISKRSYHLWCSPFSALIVLLTRKIRQNHFVFKVNNCKSPEQVYLCFSLEKTKA